MTVFDLDLEVWGSAGVLELGVHKGSPQHVLEGLRLDLLLASGCPTTSTKDQPTGSQEELERGCDTRSVGDR